MSLRNNNISTQVDLYAMNPIFAHRHRPFLSAAMRLLGKSALYYALPPSQHPPDMLDVLEQVRVLVIMSQSRFSAPDV